MLLRINVLYILHYGQFIIFKHFYLLEGEVKMKTKTKVALTLATIVFVTKVVLLRKTSKIVINNDSITLSVSKTG